MSVTRPTLTSLYRNWVLPTSSPSAVLNEMVTRGPVCIQVRTTSDAPAIAATSGTSQIQEILLFLRVTIGAGTGSSPFRSEGAGVFGVVGMFTGRMNSRVEREG